MGLDGLWHVSGKRNGKAWTVDGDVRWMHVSRNGVSQGDCCYYCELGEHCHCCYYGG